jgi:hypothetical protein
MKLQSQFEQIFLYYRTDFKHFFLESPKITKSSIPGIFIFPPGQGLRPCTPLRNQKSENRISEHKIKNCGLIETRNCRPDWTGRRSSDWQTGN